jgi:hypothetical protein
MRPLTRWDALKLIGIALMFVDHSGHFFLEDQQWLRGIGRACAPIFLFLAGFAPHYRFDRKLVGLALLLTVSDWMMKGDINTLNILWSILLIRLILGTLEKRGKYKLPLHEWVIGAIATFWLMMIFQYGSAGILIALAGYVYRHKAHYAPHTPQRFLYLTLFLYALLPALLGDFTMATNAIMAASLLALCVLVEWFLKNPSAILPCPAPLVGALKLCSRYTAFIYVGHLILFGWMTGLAI